MSDTRRSFLKKGSAAALGLGLGGATSSLSGSSLPRVGIVGGGVAGVSCAWLLDGVADAVVFESRPNVGGHAHSITVPTHAGNIIVDVGAGFFARGPHPTYTKLLEVIGLTRPDDPAGDVTIDAEMSMTVTDTSRATPRFISPASNRWWPIFAPSNFPGLWAFFMFALAARSFTKDGSWLVTLDEWLRTLPVREEEREGLLLPLLTAMVGCTIEQARGLSARSILVFVGEALPDNLLEPIIYHNSLIGLGGNIQYLAGISGNLTAHVGCPVRRVRPLPRGGFEIRNADGARELVDIVVFATPPYVTQRLLPRLPTLRRATGVLRSFEYFDAEISIHRDPVYMPGKRWNWSAYNVLFQENLSEASVWYGALQPVTPAAQGLFKSWATARAREPKDEIFRRAFLHPLITPRFIRAGRRLARHQGRENIWYAGSYTKEIDSQETALLSAMDVVRELDPQAPNLLSLGG